MSVRSSGYIMLFKLCFHIDLLSGCSSIAESWVLKSPTLIVLLSISPFNSVNVCFT